MLVSYIVMLFVNFLANSLPINNRSTGQISDAYPIFIEGFGGQYTSIILTIIICLALFLFFIGKIFYKK